MKLPQVLTDLIEAQNRLDGFAYARCFAEKAVVFDEGKIHTGRPEIQRWIEAANQKYRTHMKPLQYEESEGKSILTAECSGTFAPSPIVLKFHFVIADGEIELLDVTG